MSWSDWWISTRHLMTRIRYLSVKSVIKHPSRCSIKPSPVITKHCIFVYIVYVIICILFKRIEATFTELFVDYPLWFKHKYICWWQLTVLCHSFFLWISRITVWLIFHRSHELLVYSTVFLQFWLMLWLSKYKTNNEMSTSTSTVLFIQVSYIFFMIWCL